MKKKFPSISVCMIVKDEEDNLPRLFSSIKGLADEVIVVDTGSKDATVGIARRFGAKVYHFPWCDDFSAARNESLKHATKDFILWLDGDDELRSAEHHKIRTHLRKHPGAGVYLHTYVEGECQALQLRIFPNHRDIRFEGRIHEQVVHFMEARGIPTHMCNATIIHHGYEKHGAMPEKLMRNRQILEKEMDERPEDLNIPFFLARTYFGLGETDLALAYLDKVIDLGRRDPSARTKTVFTLAIHDKGSILAQLGRVEDALSALSYGKSIFPAFALIRLLLGKLRFERREYKEAFEELLPLKDETFDRETTPLDVPQIKKWLYRALGVSALFVEVFAVAEECFLRATIDDPLDKAAYHHLAVTRERKGDVEGAISACRLGLERVEGDAYLKKRLFFLLLNGEAFGQALECYESMNGGRMDVDALVGRFLISCKTLEATEIQLYYRLLQEKLSIEPFVFPQNIQITKNRLRETKDLRPIELFDSAIAFLMAQAA